MLIANTNCILAKDFNKNMTQPELGKKILELRKIKGLTQEELVKKCNINVRTLQRIESREVNPRSYTIKIIFDSLEFDLNEELSTKKNHIIFQLESKFKEIFKQLKKTDTMKNSKTFFQNLFLSIGIVWFICAPMILLFKLNFQRKEIILTLVFPLAYAIFKQFDKKNQSKSDKIQDKSND